MPQDSSCCIYFVRHGETDWNAIGRLQGHSDIPLNQAGLTQAIALREKLANISFAAAFSSDLSRARETARLILSSSASASLIESPSLRERYAGDFEGKHVSHYDQSLKEHFDIMQTLSKEEYLSYKWHPTVETPHEVYNRVWQFLSSQIQAYLGQNILVVSHGGVLRAFLDYLHFTPNQRWIVQNCGFIRLQVNLSALILDQHEGLVQKDLA